MTSDEIRSQIKRPEVVKLCQIADGLKVGRVLGNRVLVEPVTPRTKADELEAEGLIHLPKHVKEEHTPRPSTGIVLQVGDGVILNAITPGTMVFFSKYAGLALAIDKKQYVLLDVGDIACTLEAVAGELDAIVQAHPEDETPDVPVRAGEAII